MNDVKLQDCLRKECNRQALVKKIATVTTRSNSLNQTKENIKPVLMDGKKDSLWVTELEEIFGFPIHYTDANLQKTRRLQLLGKAWSVQTLFAILQPVFKF
uniref:DNA (cytosine-5-)-methyltransferase n=1 Tax=Trichogramma kaykai TaxID=54128 RepID=A0ABD2VZ86_9HYME